METKRYIGNDMTRLYRKVKRELGPDAVVLQTRTLHRPGDTPLIEMIAAAAPGEGSLPLDVQHTILEEALAAAERGSGRFTVADLEAYIRERDIMASPAASSFDDDALPRDWQDGRIADAGRVGPGRRREGLVAVLHAAGLSERAAIAVAEMAPVGADPVRALAAALAQTVTYPRDGETAVITMQGPPASGRTSALLRMAIDCADAGRTAVLVAADPTRAGSRDQIHASAAAAGLQSTEAFGSNDLELLADRAGAGTCLFVDVPPGTWRASPALTASHYAYRVVPTHWQDAALRAAGPQPGATYAGAVLTFTDLSTNLSPALSLVVELGLGIAFLSCNRDVSKGIALAEPLTLASGLLETTTGETANGRFAAIA